MLAILALFSTSDVTIASVNFFNVSLNLWFGVVVTLHNAYVDAYFYSYLNLLGIIWPLTYSMQGHMTKLSCV